MGYARTPLPLTFSEIEVPIKHIKTLLRKKLPSEWWLTDFCYLQSYGEDGSTTFETLLANSAEPVVQKCLLQVPLPTTAEVSLSLP